MHITSMPFRWPPSSSDLAALHPVRWPVFCLLFLTLLMKPFLLTRNPGEVTSPSWIRLTHLSIHTPRCMTSLSTPDIVVLSETATHQWNCGTGNTCFWSPCLDLVCMHTGCIENHYTFFFLLTTGLRAPHWGTSTSEDIPETSESPALMNFKCAVSIWKTHVRSLMF